MAKRERSTNWEKEEKQLLREIMKPFMSIIENKDISTNTNKEKLNAWTQITEQFNLANKRPRDKKQLVNQWKLAKLHSKKEVSNYRRQLCQTGGGPKPPSPCPETMEILEMIPQEFEVDFNTFDCDGKQVTNVKIDGNIDTVLVNEILCEPEPSTSQSGSVVVIAESKPTTTTSQPAIPPKECITTPLATVKRSGKKRILSERTHNSFDFAEASFQDMKKYRELENERQQNEHELRLKNMTELQAQVMINLKLQEKILIKILEKESHKKYNNDST